MFLVQNKNAIVDGLKGGMQHLLRCAHILLRLTVF